MSQRTIKRIILVLLIILLTFTATVIAAEFQLTQITNNSTNDQMPLIDGDYITWEGSDGTDLEIFLYQISTTTTTQLTNNTSIDNHPEINGDYIVWESYIDGTGWEPDIFLYQISTATTSQITFNNVNDYAPKIYGDYIVWHQQPSFFESNVFLYQISTATTTQLSTSGFAFLPVIDQNHIAWVDGSFFSGGQDILLYNIDTAITTQVTNDTLTDMTPDLSGDNLIWIKSDTNNQIYHYQISTGTTTNISNNSSDNQDPRIDGQNIVWISFLDGDYDIYHHNLTSGITQNISNNTAQAYDPRINGNNIIWESDVDGDFDIYHYDLSTNTLSQIANLSGTDQYPATDGNYITWYGDTDGDNEIYLVTITPSHSSSTSSSSSNAFALPQTGDTFNLPNSGFAPHQLTTLPQQPASLAYSPSNFTLTIPQLNLDARAILGVPQTNQSWDVSWLGPNIGYLAHTAYPTTIGNTILTAHVWDATNLPGPFAQLKTLAYGDQIILQTNQLTYIYAVRENTTIPTTTDLSALTKTDGYDWLTLLTCENYDSTTQSYTDRRIVQAILIEVK